MADHEMRFKFGMWLSIGAIIFILIYSLNPRIHIVDANGNPVKLKDYLLSYIIPK